jgi:hypothetical protein
MKNIQNFQEFIAESLINENAQHGFDLTEISSQNWKKVLASVNIKPESCEKTEDSGWLWKNDKISIYAANDPITGKHYKMSNRIEKNYASYIGLEGDPDEVESVALLIKQLGQSKGESKNSRNYI